MGTESLEGHVKEEKELNPYHSRSFACSFHNTPDVEIVTIPTLQMRKSMLTEKKYRLNEDAEDFL